jgi:hypothetical protein
VSHSSHSVTDLYRYYDSDGNLLYLGISLNAAKRASEHRKDKHWWNEVATIKIEHLPTGDRALVLEIEADLIKAEKPKYNVVHNYGTAAGHRPIVARDWDFSGLALDRTTRQAFLDLVRTLAECVFVHDKAQTEDERLFAGLPLFDLFTDLPIMKMSADLPILMEMSTYLDGCDHCERERVANPEYGNAIYATNKPQLIHHQPYRALMDRDWALMHYYCDRHGHFWTCGYSVEGTVLAR